MGWGIAQVFAQAGYQVTLCDRELWLAQNGKGAMEKALHKLVQKNKITQQEKDEILARVIPGILSDAKDSQMMVEAIYENLEAKQDVYRRMEEIIAPDALMVSNTSSLSITELSGCLQDPSRFAGMHFFNPAAVMELVEIIGGAHSSEQTLKEISLITKQIGKVSVDVKESPGFVVNRILIPMINEAIGIYSEGAASAEDIDTAMMLGANHPIGPLRLGDLIGLDVCLAIMEVLQKETGDTKYRAHPLLRKMVRAGTLGRKSKKGFYQY